MFKNIGGDIPGGNFLGGSFPGGGGGVDGCEFSGKKFSWYLVIIFLLLCDNKNLSPWHNILSDVWKKNLVLHEK